MRHLLGRPIEDLTNRAVAVTDLFGPHAADLRERLREAPSWDARFAMIEAFVVPRVLGHTTLPAGVRCAWERLLGSGGRVAIGDLVDDIGPGAGDRGGRVVVAWPPAEVARSADSRTAPFLARALGPLEGRWTSDTVDRAPS